MTIKTILGLVGSQRKVANGEILLKEVASSCGEDYKLELIRLPELKLEPCRACYACLEPGKLCPIKDDLYFLCEKIKMADGIILAAPSYFLGPAAITKLWSDRTIAIAQRLEDFWDKPIIIIATAGIKGWEGYTLSALIAIARFMGLKIKDAKMFIGALPGETLENSVIRQQVKAMGKALFGIPSEIESGRCPTCCSEIWKFPKPNFAVCPLCAQEAILEFQEDEVKWVFGPSGKRFDHLSLEHHFLEFLPLKVKEYIERRKELALIRNPYETKDNWLKPIKSE
ncbi:MAG: flavodoxin family protein [Desulfitobacteriaceae bacterium]